ncbi:MAG: class II aldolase/adducin family protein [Ilumatobacteraceae bacterium]
MAHSVVAGDERTTRIELAAAFRLAARFGWHESVANHFSAAVTDDGSRFLMNPRWRHFSLITASELLLLDAGDASVMDRPDAPDVSAWNIHGAIHAAVPNARVLLHLHPPFATTIATLQDPTILPIDQNTARFFGDVAYDLEFGGIADDPAEGRRLAGVLGDRSVLMMGNHGVTTIGRTVAEAFESMYYLERACQTLVQAYSCGRPLSVLSDEMATKVATSWKQFDTGQAHLDQLMVVLDAEDRSYRE